ncbi:MAG: hypothetical protein WBY88_01610 [Desulfosarcina sp.]
MKVKFAIFHILTLAVLLVPTVNAAGERGNDLIQYLETGCVDWSRATVRARGIAVPTSIDGDRPSDLSPSDSFETARQAAQSRLMQAVEAIRINHAFRVGDRAAASTAFRDGLTTLVRNASITHKNDFSDGTVEIELTMNLTGGFAQFVLPEEIRQVDSVVTMGADEPAVNKPTTDGAEGGPHTGLILDATGIGAQPCLVPVVIDESGEVVYGPAFVSREFAVSQGMCGFTTTLADARNDNRVGRRPLIVKAIRTRPGKRTHLVVSSTDAARLRSSVVHLNFLKACRVNIVMDPQLSPASAPLY